MAPNIRASTTTGEEVPPDKGALHGVPPATAQTAPGPAAAHNPPPETGARSGLVLRSAALLLSLHVLAVVGLVRGMASADRRTIANAWFWGLAGGLGVTAGAHRLWAHRAYSARLPLRVLLMVLFTVAGQNDIYEWVRDHRLHHRHSETDADPHNARRGFFFAHCGWLMVRKHPQVRRQGAKIDLSDLLDDPVVVFQKRHYPLLMVTFCLVVPTLLPWLCWGEDFWTAFLVCGIFKYAASLHCTWLVNSAAHIWGMHPYDEHISPAENVAVAVAALGEGWHNYHHVFPWDYRAAELPGYGANFTTGFIDLWARLGWAHGLKTVPADQVRRRAARTGDGSWRQRRS